MPLLYKRPDFGDQNFVEEYKYVKIERSKTKAGMYDFDFGVEELEDVYYKRVLVKSDEKRKKNERFVGDGYF